MELLFSKRISVSYSSRTLSNLWNKQYFCLLSGSMDKDIDLSSKKTLYIAPILIKRLFENKNKSYFRQNQ